MQEIIINTPSGRCTAIIGVGVLSRLADALAGASSVVIVTDENVAPLYGPSTAEALQQAGIIVHEWILPPGEASKSLWQAECLYDFMASKKSDRDSAIVALGGGVVGDLAGFAASTWLRGIRFVNCPTTLLSAVDAGIGGKTGLNHAGLKNLIGSFYQPETVIADVSTLNSLDDRTFNCGMAESIKHGIIADAAFFEWQADHAETIRARAPAILEELITRNLSIKAGIVEQDERDRTGERAKLNFGHTIGHALEVVSGYGLPHGECVGLGMIGALHIAVGRGLIEASVIDRVRQALGKFSLPHRFKYQGDVEAIMAALQRDKKSARGCARFVLPTQIGEVSAGHEIEDGEIRSALGQLIA